MYTGLLIAGVFGPWQVVIIILALLLLFGGKKIPELMKGLGQGINEFKKATKDKDSTEEKKDNNDSQKE